MNDLAEVDFSPNPFRQYEGVERQKQLVVSGEFVREDEPNRDELPGLAAPCWRHPLYRLNGGFQILRTDRKFMSQRPFGCIEVFCIEYAKHASIGRRTYGQTLDFLAVIRFIVNPERII